MPEEIAAQLAPGAPKLEPEIHVIPDEFYGAAAKAKLSKPKPAPRTAVQATAAAAPGQAAAPPQAPPPVRRGSKKWLLIPVFAVIFLALLGFGTWLLLRPREAPAPSPPPPSVSIQIPPSAPAPEPVAEAPPEEPEPEPAPEPEPQVEPEPPPPPPPPISTAPWTYRVPAVTDDRDGDGLSAAEEALYGTDPENADSDRDGFSDALEVVNLYNPAGFTPTRLIEAGLVTAHASEEGGFEIFFPVSWEARLQGEGEVLFTNPENEPIAVTVEENPQGQSILDWYLSRNPSVSPVEVQQFFTKSGLEGVRSPNGLAAYIRGGDRVYIVAYAPGLSDSVHFRATFFMMVNSFRLLP